MDNKQQKEMGLYYEADGLQSQVFKGEQPYTEGKFTQQQKSLLELINGKFGSKGLAVKSGTIYLANKSDIDENGNAGKTLRNIMSGSDKEINNFLQGVKLGIFKD